MERISRFLERHQDPVSRNAIEKDVEGKATAKRTAIDRLIVEGYATESEGARGARLVHNPDHVRARSRAAGRGRLPHCGPGDQAAGLARRT